MLSLSPQKISCATQEFVTTDDVAISKDGQWAAIGENGRCAVWKLTSGVWERNALLELPEGRIGNNAPVVINNDGTLIAFGSGSSPSRGGRVVIYARDNSSWELSDTIFDEAVPNNVNFGISLFLNETSLVVGAIDYVYIFTKTLTNKWKQATKISKNEHCFYAETDPYFLNDIDKIEPREYGASVYLNPQGNILVVGAPGTNITQSKLETGAAFVYSKIGNIWKLTSIVYDENVVAYKDAELVYIAARDEYLEALAEFGSVDPITQEKREIKNSAKAQMDVISLNVNEQTRFGSSVSISSDNTLVVGAPGDSYPYTEIRIVTDPNTGLSEVVEVEVYSTDAGSVSTYDVSLSSYTFRNKIYAEIKKNDVFFGSKVFISNDGNTLYASAPNSKTYVLNEDTDNATPVPRDGSLFKYSKSGNNWVLEQELNPTDGSYSINSESFKNAGSSFSVADSGNLLMITNISKKLINEYNTNEVYYYTE
jgi:hypothetical protein